MTTMDEIWMLVPSETPRSQESPPPSRLLPGVSQGQIRGTPAKGTILATMSAAPHLALPAPGMFRGQRAPSAFMSQ